MFVSGAQERYPVHAALGANQPNLVGQILRSTRHNATNLNAWINKCTPLTYAARFGLLEVARELVTHGADINRRQGVDSSFEMIFICYTYMCVYIIPGKKVGNNDAKT